MADKAEAAGSEALHDADFLAWTEQQARAVAECRWSDIDIGRLVEELQSLGLAIVQEAEERTEILLSYLLKWRHLDQIYRGRAWEETIELQRQAVAALFAKNPRLEEKRDALVASGYEDARRRLRYETYFRETDFPASCPFTVDQVFDPNFLPTDLDSSTATPPSRARRIA